PFLIHPLRSASSNEGGWRLEDSGSIARKFPVEFLREPTGVRCLETIGQDYAPFSSSGQDIRSVQSQIRPERLLLRILTQTDRWHGKLRRPKWHRRLSTTQVERE